MLPDRYDVITVGAGPAGSLCARECAKRGLSVLLLDREAFPRPKPCGGAVSERALSCLDLPLPQEVIEWECYGVRVHFGRSTIEVRRDHRIAVLVNREKFDTYLAKRAMEQGVVFKQREGVTGVKRIGDVLEVRTDLGTYLAHYVVGADGANSIVSRTIRAPYSRTEVMAALVSAVPADDEEIESRLGGMLELHFGVAPRGYGWVFPHKGHYSLGIMGLASELTGAQERFAEFAGRTGLSACAVRGHTIPLGGYRRKITGDNVLLVGDAAGFADPFHGEGISNALKSAKMAAQAVIGSLNGKKDMLAWYEGECDRRIRKEMKIALQMARLLEKYPRLFLTVFFRDTKALDTFLDIPAGRSDYIRFRRWLAARLPFFLFSGHIISKP